jgi:hypothetical protein
VGNVIVDGGVQMAVHAIKPDLVFNCCYSKLFPAWDFPVELTLDLFDAIRSAKRVDNYGASNIVLPCPGS